jgi:hypothetical protein
MVCVCVQSHREPPGYPRVLCLAILRQHQVRGQSRRTQSRVYPQAAHMHTRAADHQGNAGRQAGRQAEAGRLQRTCTHGHPRHRSAVHVSSAQDVPAPAAAPPSTHTGTAPMRTHMDARATHCGAASRGTCSARIRTHKQHAGTIGRAQHTRTHTSRESSSL